MKRNTPDNEDDFSSRESNSGLFISESSETNLEEENPNMSLVSFPQEILETIFLKIPFGYYPFIRSTNRLFLNLTDSLSKLEEPRDEKGNEILEYFTPQQDLVDFFPAKHGLVYCEHPFSKLKKTLPYESEIPKAVIPFYKKSKFISDFGPLVFRDVVTRDDRNGVRDGTAGFFWDCEMKTRVRYLEFMCILNIVAHGDLEFLQKNLKVKYLTTIGIFEVALAHGQMHILKWLHKLDCPFNGEKTLETIQRFGSLELNLEAYRRYGSFKVQLTGCLMEGRYNLFKNLCYLDTKPLVNEMLVTTNASTGYKLKGTLELMVSRGNMDMFKYIIMLEPSHFKCPLTELSYFQCIRSGLINGQIDSVLSLIYMDYMGDFIGIYGLQDVHLSRFITSLYLAQLICADIQVGHLVQVTTALSQAYPHAKDVLLLRGDSILRIVEIYGVESLNLFDDSCTWDPDDEIYNVQNCTLEIVKTLYEKFRILPTKHVLQNCFSHHNHELFEWLYTNFLLLKYYQSDDFDNLLTRIILGHTDDDNDDDGTDLMYFYTTKRQRTEFQNSSIAFLKAVTAQVRKFEPGFVFPTIVVDIAIENKMHIFLEGILTELNSEQILSFFKSESKKFKQKIKDCECYTPNDHETCFKHGVEKIWSLVLEMTKN